MSEDLNTLLTHMTSEPGVYRMLDQHGQVLYVGKAAQLKKRVSSYFTQKNISAKTRSLVQQIHSIEVTVTRSETEALLLESNLIKSLRPKYNVLMRDDKSYPFIHISKHPFPRIEAIRCKKKPEGGDFFGPYPSGTAVRETLNLIHKIFKIRNCRDSYFNARSRPCLQYQIKRCSAPCTNHIHQAEYQRIIENTRRFLQGKSQQILQELTQRMQTAAIQLDFEEAAQLRDQIKHLRLVQEQQSVIDISGEADVIAIAAQPGFACVQWVSIRHGQVIASDSFFPTVPAHSLDDDPEALWQQVFEVFINYYYLSMPQRIPALLIIGHPINNHASFETILAQFRGKACRIQTRPRGLKARWLDFASHNLQVSIAKKSTSTAMMQTRMEALADLLHLPSPITRMECFDISHTQGQDTVASCVVFDEYGPNKREYRRFNIQNITAGDDYAAIKQAVTRRFKRLTAENNLPDLLIIDGGKGQVTMAQQVLASLNAHQVKLVGIAKGPSRKAGWEKLILADSEKEQTLLSDSPALHLLQHIRDEAHRFAITTHRKKRQKSSLSSSLETLDGIGPKRRQALLHRFGGLRELAKAPLDEIAKVAGISQALAERIYAYFHT